MMADPVAYLREYLPEALVYHLGLIRGDNPEAFTRFRKLSVSDLLLQMLNRKGQTQWSEVKELFSNMKKPSVTEKGFYQARMKFNPAAVRMMANEYIANVYDNNDDSLTKCNGLLFLAIDGSKCTIPSTKENEAYFGKASGLTDNMPVQALISTLHDSLNNTKLDIIVSRINASEKEMASKHIDHYCDNYTQPALFIFDRGYVSIRLIDQIILKKQFFLFRSKSTDYKKYFDQVEVGTSKVFDVTFDRITTNEYRNDIKFRQHLMNTVFKIRFAKVVIGTDENGNDIVETLITNLPEDLFSDDDLRDAYWKRWGTESSYNRLKNRMKMEEFSGFKPTLILQDFYADMWVYNLISLKIIQMNEQKPIDQPEDGKYVIKRNFNKAIGTMRKHLLKALIAPTAEERNEALTSIDKDIGEALTWIKNENRVFERKSPVNKSGMSYRKTY